MVRVAEEVWREWESERLNDEPVVMLRFEPNGDVDAATRAIRELLREVTDVFDARLEAAGDPLYIGEWSWLRVSDAVLVNAIESDVVDQVLLEVVRELEQRGIEGVFRLREPASSVTTPSIAHHLECRMRVRGRRVRHLPDAYRWLPDRDAHAAILVAAVDWCRQQPRSRAWSIRKDTFAAIPASESEPFAETMLDAVDEDRGVTVACVAGTEFRATAADPYAGSVSLVTGGPAIADGGWSTALAGFTALLREQADHVAYAYVRRGWIASQALAHGWLPAEDWPWRPDQAPRRPTTAQAFEDVYAPDVFGAQLLGPGYADRLPEGGAWRIEPVGNGSALVEHADPPAWFGAPFVPYEQQLPADQRPVPDVLRAARSELAPLLYSPGVLHRAGYASEPEL
jgi:hypothetical protein